MQRGQHTRHAMVDGVRVRNYAMPDSGFARELDALLAARAGRRDGASYR